jgi:hypothetical protein
VYVKVLPANTKLMPRVARALGVPVVVIGPTKYVACKKARLTAVIRNEGKLALRKPWIVTLAPAFNVIPSKLPTAPG